MAPKNLPPVSLLRQLLNYDAGTGILTWRERTPNMFKAGNRTPLANCTRWNKIFSGKATGSRGGHGYLVVRLGSCVYQAHRLVWMMQNGVEPDEIDHINGDRADNRIANLRDVPRAKNRLNQKRYENNKSGIPGVFWDASRDRWRSYISIDRRRISLGQFDDIDDAVRVRKIAEARLGFHKNHGRD